MILNNNALGLLALVLCFTIYVISSTSMGKRSISHAWLFSGLLAIHPTEECLKQQGYESTNNSTPEGVTPRRRNPPSPSNQKRTLIKQLSDLSFTCKSIQPGSVPLSLMTDKNQVEFQQWQALDALVCFGVACLVALLGPWALACYRLNFQPEQMACCEDLDCWKHWWNEQLGGVGWIVSTSNRIPPNTVLLLLTGISVWFWWRLVMHATRLPQGSTFRFSPFSYINAWFMAFATLFLLQMTSDDNEIIDLQEDTNNAVSMPIFGVSLNEALKEFSIRVTAWVGLTGFFSPDDPIAEERVLKTVLPTTNLLLVISASLLGFAVADPLRETMHLYWSTLCGDEVDLVHESTSKLVRLLRRYQGQNTLFCMTVLPLLCWITYLIPAESLQHTGASPRLIRAVFAWFFVWTMACVMKPLLQKYLQQSVAAVDSLLEVSKRPSAEEVLFPFENRYRSLVATGSQLIIFPFIVLMILVMGHGAGNPPAIMSNNNSIGALSTGFYPYIYHHSLWTDQELNRFEQWEEFQSRTLAHQNADETNAWAKLTLTGSYVGHCPHKNQTVSFSSNTRPQNKNNAAEVNVSEEYGIPFRIASTTQLQAYKQVFSIHFVEILRRLQKLARQSQIENRRMSAESMDKQWQKAWQDFYIHLQALLFHPVLTSTIVMPILDFFGFVLSTLWMLYFVYYGCSSWPHRRHRRRHALLIREDTCRVISSARAATS